MFPLIEWTPKVDAGGKPKESLFYINKYLVKDKDGKNISQTIMITDQDLEQEGPTKIFTPMPDSINVEWAWVNLADRKPEPIDFKMRMVSVQEINSINEYILDHKKTVVQDVLETMGGSMDNDSSFM